MQLCSTASLLRPLRSPVSIGYGTCSPRLHMRGAALGALSASTSTGAPATAAACQQAGAAARRPEPPGAPGRPAAAGVPGARDPAPAARRLPGRVHGERGPRHRRAHAGAAARGAAARHRAAGAARPRACREDRVYAPAPEHHPTIRLSCTVPPVLALLRFARTGPPACSCAPCGRPARRPALHPQVPQRHGPRAAALCGGCCARARMRGAAWQADARPVVNSGPCCLQAC